MAQLLLKRSNPEADMCQKLVTVALLFVASTAPLQSQPAKDIDQAIIDLYQSGKLFDKAQHKSVRKAFADVFAAGHENEIRQGFGEDHDKLTAWLKDRPDVCEKFFTAVDEKHDKVPRVMELFHEIWKLHPKQIEKHHNLAIAVAVVWDDPRGVYDYVRHQKRVKSSLPGDRIEAMENFKYILDNDKVTEGRIPYYPWEFLTFVIDHRTPLAERTWAQGYYQTNKTKGISWHKDVPYDKGLIELEQKGANLKPKLAGFDYTLANIHSRGGVCAHQADFACRVGKSIGIPAVYCSGASAYRGRHAWWMYVQITQASFDKLTFTLQSDGRFQGFLKDAFYTGFVLNPQTGKELLDRDMERRLWAIGTDRNGKRQADWAMRVYAPLREQLNLDTKARVAYLDKCLKLSIYSDDAWHELGKLARSGIAAGDAKRLSELLNTIHKTFAKHPDFIAKILDGGLADALPKNSERLKLYEKTITQFESAKRPDLVCAARLQIADLQGADDKWKAAAEGLTQTIRKYPNEGRYIPKLTGKLGDIAPKVPGAVKSTGALYAELIPAMIAYYRDDQGEYCKQMIGQALKFCEEHQLKATEREVKNAIERARSLLKK